VKWLVGDVVMGPCFEVAKKLGIRVASFWAASAACLAIMLDAPKLIEEGLIDDKGKCRRRTRDLMIRLVVLSSTFLTMGTNPIA
jgi:hypothetical protein